MWHHSGKVLKTYLGDYPEILDQSQRQHYELCTIQALANIHFHRGSAYQQARRRLAFEELLLFNCA